MKTHFKIFVRNETSFWTGEMQKKAGGAIFRAYLFDSLRPVNCCELTPSYELFPLYTTPWRDDEEHSVWGEIAASEDDEVRYIHCHVFHYSPRAAIYDCGEQDVPDDMTWDEFRESEEDRYRSNVMIEFPQGYQGPETAHA